MADSVPSCRFHPHCLLGERGYFRGAPLPHSALHVLVRLSTDEVSRKADVGTHVGVVV